MALGIEDLQEPRSRRLQSEPVDFRLTSLAASGAGPERATLDRPASNTRYSATVPTDPRRVDLDRLPQGWKVVAGSQQRVAFRIASRAADILLSAGLLVFTLPLLLMTAIAIKFDSRGGIFYTQERVGLNGKIFTILKFRTMIADAEAGGLARWATQGDPRITRLGRFLRLTRIDEVPQIWNVLRGDMAFIGPRPERPNFVSDLERAIPHFVQRAAVKPGITGWAQVNFPYGASIEDARMKLSFDLYYIEHRSFMLDARILLSTVRVVLSRDGAR